MGTLKRFTSSITAHFNWMLSQVENHEALVNSAIQEVQESGARAKVQLKRVALDGQRMRQRLMELRDAAVLWEERAKKCAGIDEKKALECLKRKKKAERQIAELEEQEREHAKVQKTLGSDLELLDERMKQLKAQRNLLKTRESRARALGALQQDSTSLIGEIDDIFDRWESRVNEYEIKGECPLSNTDDLDDEFSSGEEEEELRLELAKMLEGAGDAC